jgi:uncharacterized protein (TIGR02246 family)
MHNRYTWPAVLVLAALLAGCNEAPAPAPDTRASDAKAIRALETSWQQLYATKDVDQITAVYADDASVFMPGAPVLNGVEAIKTALKPIVKSKGFSLSFESTDVVVAKSGDLAYSQGAYTMTRTNPKTKKERASTSRSTRSSPPAGGKPSRTFSTKMLQPQQRKTTRLPRHTPRTPHTPHAQVTSIVDTPSPAPARSVRIPRRQPGVGVGNQ